MSAVPEGLHQRSAAHAQVAPAGRDAGWAKRERRLLAQPGCIALALLATYGCATVPYRYGANIETPNTLRLREDEPQIERGRRVWVVDFLGNVFGIPSKLLLLHWKVDRHFISAETEAALADYLAANDLRNVKVRLNQYAPAGEWSRLVRNRAVGVGWRATLGTLSMIFYTVLPGRLFGGDNYNPYTNTINLYSDLPAIALHEGGHAKDFAPRRWKGTYAFLYALPFFALYPEARATGDALGYLKAEGLAAREKEAYKVLYPAYATYVGGSFSDYFPYPGVYLGPVLVGHAVGRVKAAQVPAPEAASEGSGPETEPAGEKERAP